MQVMGAAPRLLPHRPTSRRSPPSSGSTGHWATRSSVYTGAPINVNSVALCVVRNYTFAQGVRMVADLDEDDEAVGG